MKEELLLFSANSCSDMWIIGLGDALTSVYAGCAVFATLGHMAYQLQLDVDQVAVKGNHTDNESRQSASVL